MTFLKPRSTETNRDKLMTVAELAILEKGYAATSIEEVIAEVGITKSGFFYHFRDKSELVKAILERHLIAEDAWFESMFSRARELSDDPLQEYLIFLRLLRESMESLPDVHPGCLIAATCFQERLFERDVHELADAALRKWREQFHTRLTKIAEIYPPKVEVDLVALADMVTVLTDGGIILSKTFREKEVLPRQIELYRQFIKSIFLSPQPRGTH
ncbi:TetR/AcrR family transcriptional regulator [Roseovarius faecimaris]|uniref:TetR/AcrR family transcriptional regulator n=1 Tax=Roseovarius faecimaris TaxID=2494550 RepID=A0A6I6IQK0_9RHOB|nr:TetR/AcrR family transcriptional regulator [Roseovarius faecimaris]QGX99460.1 TetR/AcrR family transcriptional regulator [Roseovarius faecimaris]